MAKYLYLLKFIFTKVPTLSSFRSIFCVYCTFLHRLPRLRILDYFSGEFYAQCRKLNSLFFCLLCAPAAIKFSNCVPISSPVVWGGGPRMPLVGLEPTSTRCGWFRVNWVYHFLHKGLNVKKDRDEYGSMILCYVLIANFRMLRIDNISSLIRYQLLIVIYLANPPHQRWGGGWP